MDLRPYVDDIHAQLAAAAEAGGEEARVLAERLVAPLDAAIRLALQDALAAAAEQITCELAPGSVELRLRGREPEFVVTRPPADGAPDVLSDDGGYGEPGAGAAVGAPALIEADDGTVARINLRMPDQLKARIEQAAVAEAMSVNSWLVRAASAALERNDLGRRREAPTPRGRQRFTGWVR